MVRSGQMILATALDHYLLGAHWRLGTSSCSELSIHRQVQLCGVFNNSVGILFLPTWSGTATHYPGMFLSIECAWTRARLDKARVCKS